MNLKQMKTDFIVLLYEVTYRLRISVLIQIFTLQLELIILHTFIYRLWKPTKFISTEPIKLRLFGGLQIFTSYLMFRGPVEFLVCIDIVENVFAIIYQIRHDSVCSLR